VRADYGKLYERRTRALAKGNVIVTSEDGKRLETETLYWDREKDLLYTHDFVKITTPKEIIEGYGMEANTSFSWYKIYRLRGVFEIENAN
jgi:LPS export ABC transporter protein LptC